MLCFSRKPDQVFTAILHAALESEAERSKGVETADVDWWEGCYPHSLRYFDAATAAELMEQLYCASRDPIIYRPTDYHWLLLYEVLQNFCVIHNDLAPDAPNGWRPIGEYKVREIDFQALIERYFWDTDFLMAPDGLNGSETDQDAGHLKPEQLQFEAVESPWDNDAAASDDFSVKHGLRYPEEADR